MNTDRDTTASQAVLDIARVARELRETVKQYLFERTRPVSSNNAFRLHARMSVLHDRLALMMGGCHMHMTPAERAYRQMTSADLLVIAENWGSGATSQAKRRT